jgi:hypothetical protein
MGPQTGPVRRILRRSLRRCCDAETEDQKLQQTEAAAGPHC